MGIQNVGLQALTLLTTAVLARILSPEDFGLVAIVTVVVGLFGLVNQAGWGAALVVRDEITVGAVSSAFWASLGLGGLTAAAAAGLADPIASMFGSPAAADLIRGISPVLVFGQPAGVARSLLTRDLRYRALSLLALAQQVVYAAIAIILAAGLGFGVWSIIIGRVAAAALALFLAFVVARPPVRFRFERQEFAADLQFNAGFLGNRVASYFGKNVDYWVVGRFLGEGPLGFYYIAYVVPNIIRRRFTQTLQATLFPLFANVNEDSGRMRRMWSESLRTALLVVGPAMGGLVLLARPALRVGFGEQWLAAAPVMRVLAVAAVIELFVVSAGSVFVARKKPHLTAALNGVRFVVVGAMAIPAARLGGALGVGAVVLIGSVGVASISLVLLRREIGVGIKDLTGSTAPLLLPLVAMAGAVALTVRALAATDALLVLGASAVAGGCAYVLSGMLFHKDAFSTLLKDAAGVLGYRHKGRT